MSSNSQRGNFNGDSFNCKDIESELERTNDAENHEETGENLNFEEHEWLSSQVKTKNYIFNPPSFEDKSDEEKEMGGKWMIFAHSDFEKLDHRWVVLEELIKNGIILAIKSSTGNDPIYGVTMCYTSDFANIAEVKKAGDEIRKLIDYDFIMYYKTNEASAAGNYRREGSTDVCLYMHSVKGRFYIKDEYKRWKFLDI